MKQKIITGDKLSNKQFGIARNCYGHSGRLVIKRDEKLVLLSVGDTRIGDYWRNSRAIQVQPISNKYANQLLNKDENRQGKYVLEQME
jgi:hypothetical protein